jgi:hypothetical protein
VKLTDITPPLGAHYAVYRVGHGRSTAIVIVAQDDEGQWERVGRIPPYLLEHMLEGLIRTDIAVWDADEQSYLNGTALQMVYVAPPPFAPAPKPPAKNLEQLDRNWAMWRERVMDGTMYKVLGSRYGIHAGRVQQIVLKCSRRVRNRICWPDNTSAEHAEPIDKALRDFEIVWPNGERPHMIAPNGTRVEI